MSARDERNLQYLLIFQGGLCPQPGHCRNGFRRDIFSWLLQLFADRHNRRTNSPLQHVQLFLLKIDLAIEQLRQLISFFKVHKTKKPFKKSETIPGRQESRLSEVLFNLSSSLKSRRLLKYSLFRPNRSAASLTVGIEQYFRIRPAVNTFFKNGKPLRVDSLLQQK